MTYTWKPAPADTGGCLMSLILFPFVVLRLSGRRVAMHKHWTWTG